MESVRFVPRSDWYGDRLPHMNDGIRPRPHLELPVPTLGGHYRGSPINDAGTAQAVDYMPDFQRRAQAQGKSFEYNYVIPPRTNGRPEVWEYAGLYRAAHATKNNSVVIGVQFANGVNNHPSFSWYNPGEPTVWEPLTDEQIAAWRWLRDVHLTGLGAIDVRYVDQKQHRQLPHAATICPGEAIINRWGDLLEPYTPPPAPEPVPESAPVIIIHHTECNMYFHAETGQLLAGVEEIDHYRHNVDNVTFVQTAHGPTLDRFKHINGPKVAALIDRRVAEKPWET